VHTKSIWILKTRRTIARVVEIVDVMNKKSMLDRDNIELYIMSEEEEQELMELLLEEYHETKAGDREKFADVELQEWQEQILNKEFGDEKK
jgi:hypothetical protein